MHGVPVNLITQKTADADELFVCPFDPSHRISAMRFVGHVLKCKKNFPHIELETCPFNARHLVKPPEIRHHVSICPDKHTLEREQQSQGEFAPSAEPTAARSSQYLNFSDDESWDEEISRSKKHSVLETFDKALLTGAKYSYEKVRVERIKSELKERQERASQAQALPSRRPIYGTGTKLSGAVGAVSNQSSGATNDGANSKMRPRLAANFAIRPDLPEKRGRGWFFHDRDSYVPGRGRGLGSSLLSDRSNYNACSSVGNARGVGDENEKLREGRCDSDM